MSLSIKNAPVIVSLMNQCWSVRAEGIAQQNAPVFGLGDMTGHGGVIMDAVPVVPVVPVVPIGRGMDEAPALHFGPAIGGIEPPALHFGPRGISGGDVFAFDHGDDHMELSGGPNDAPGHLRRASAFYYRR